jgi:hypothetical protein
MAVKKPLVMTNGQIEQLQAGDSIAAQQPTITLTNGNAGAIVCGTPVYSSDAGEYDEAQADDAGTKDVIGLQVDTSVATTDPGQIQQEGTLTLTTGEWDAVTGQTGGLTPGSKYWLDAANPGQMTPTAPTTDSQFVCPLGVALSATVFKIQIQVTVRL